MSGDFVVRTGWPEFDKKIMHKLENPELAVSKFQNAAYKFAFLLVPISLPFLWLLFFWKRGLTLFDHTVYILYSLSFVSLLFIVISLMSSWSLSPDWDHCCCWLSRFTPSSSSRAAMALAGSRRCGARRC